MKTAILALLFCSACASGQAQVSCPTPERGEWVVAYASSEPGLVVADICDEQVNDDLNELTCRDRAAQFNREQVASGGMPIYFATWNEE